MSNKTYEVGTIESGCDLISDVMFDLEDNDDIDCLTIGDGNGHVLFSLNINQYKHNHPQENSITSDDVFREYRNNNVQSQNN